MKYQVSFRAKTGYLHMWKYHLCYDFNKLHLSDQKNYFSKMVWYIFQHSKKNFLSPRSRVVSSISTAVLRV